MSETSETDDVTEDDVAESDVLVLVRVRAQVMVKDGSTGGWVPEGTGGLSSVAVIRERIPPTPTSTATATTTTTTTTESNNNNSNKPSTSSSSTSVATPPPPPPCNHEEQQNSTNLDNNNSVNNKEKKEPPRYNYIIYGERLHDQTLPDISAPAAPEATFMRARRSNKSQVVLNSILRQNFVYHKVMPCFHHWSLGEEKAGLAFVTAADARLFDLGVKVAIEAVLAGMAADYQDIQNNRPEAAGHNEVFMALDLPVERGDSQTSSDSSSVRTVRTPPVWQSPKPIESTPQSMHKPLPQPPPPTEEGSTGYSYVHLSTVHEYFYPLVEEGKSSSTGVPEESGESLKKWSPVDEYPATKVMGLGGFRRKERCRYCQEPFYPEQNPRGACEYAPDRVRSAINAVSCISCAQCMLYHCMSDPEGDFVQNPCECGPLEESCWKRWLGLALLSLCVPCLWCYLPLRGCHLGCVACGLCGGRHATAQQQ